MVRSVSTSRGDGGDRSERDAHAEDRLPNMRETPTSASIAGDRNNRSTSDVGNVPRGTSSNKLLITYLIRRSKKRGMFVGSKRLVPGETHPVASDKTLDQSDSPFVSREPPTVLLQDGVSCESTFLCKLLHGDIFNSGRCVSHFES